MRIDVISQLAANAREASQTKLAESGGGDFGAMFTDALKEVNQTNQESVRLQKAFVAGSPAVEMQDVMIAMEKASIAMQMTMQVRNKLLEAYQEISRMQI